MVAAGLCRAEDVPARYRELAPDLTGDSCIVDPRGEVVAGPAKGEAILTARGSLEAVLAAKAACDVGGHYSRPDVLRLLVDRRPPERLVEPAGAEPTARARRDGLTHDGAVADPAAAGSGNGAGSALVK